MKLFQGPMYCDFSPLLAESQSYWMFETRPPLGWRDARKFLLLIVLAAWALMSTLAMAAEKTDLRSNEQKHLVVKVNLSLPSSYRLADERGQVSKLDFSSEGIPVIGEKTVGWIQYPLSVPFSGWWRLDLISKGVIENLRWTASYGQTATIAASEWASGRRVGEWEWLEKGQRTLTVSSSSWIGFPKLQAISMLSAGFYDAPFFVIHGPDRSAVSLNGCAPLRLRVGSGSGDASLSVITSSASKHEIIPIEMDRSIGGREAIVPVPCNTVGDQKIAIVSSTSPDREIVAQHYSVFDKDRSTCSTLVRRRLIHNIDASRQPPDYSSGASIVKDEDGGYRDVGPAGVTRYQRGETENKPSWIAYSVTGLRVGQPYFVDVEVPDTAERVMSFAFRSDLQEGYPVSVALETGGQWKLSYQRVSRSMVIWPSNSEGRLIVFTMHDAQNAAISGIKIYEAEAVMATQNRNRERRDFAIFSEEGRSFHSIAGLASSRHSIHQAVSRYITLAKMTGATIVVPNMVAYAYQLYPSKYHLAFQSDVADTLAAFLLVGEACGIDIIPEFHPRADELMWNEKSTDAMSARLSLSKNGTSNLISPNGLRTRPPFYNVNDREVQDWYIGMLKEVASGYKRHSAFKGVQLRISHWQNPGLNNWVSLDWGYSAKVVRSFFHETGINIPANLELGRDSADLSQERYKLLTGPLRHDWISWRCMKVTELFRRIARDVQKIRRDLTVNVHLALSDFGHVTSNNDLREMGIDVAALREIEGLVVIDGRAQHGAHEASASWQSDVRRRHLIPDLIAGLESLRSRPSTLEPMQYLEIVPGTVKAADLGLKEGSGGEHWISAASEPPGPLRVARFAETLAAYDVFMLGDGGNSWIFDDGPLASFVREFTVLPRRKFINVNPANVNYSAYRLNDTFYVVNLTGENLTLNAHVPKSKWVRHIVSGRVTAAYLGYIRLEIPPYGLKVWKADRTIEHIKFQDVSFPNQEAF